MQTCNPDYTGLITAIVAFLAVATGYLKFLLDSNKKDLAAKLQDVKEKVCDGQCTILEKVKSAKSRVKKPPDVTP